MAKRRRRREQQHLGQQPSRRRNYRTGGTAPAEKYKPGFPMNLFMNMKVFFVVGVVIMAGGVILAAVLQVQGGAAPVDDLPTATPTTAVSPSPSVSPTPDPRQFTEPEQVIDAAVYDYRARIQTAKGEIVIEFFDEVAPNTVNSFVFLAQQDFYDDLAIHRVEPNFVVQAGDPRSEGGQDPNAQPGPDGPGYTVGDEPNEIRNTRGTIAMAKRQGATEFGSQWFINLKDNPALDFDSGNPTLFYPFGEVVEGMDVVESLEVGDLIQDVVIEEAEDPDPPTPTPEPTSEATAEATETPAE